MASRGQFFVGGTMKRSVGKNQDLSLRERSSMIVHDVSWEIDATRDEIWSIFHPEKTYDPRTTTLFNPRVIEHRNVRIEIIHEGDETGQGLVRRTWYAVPWYVGGRARSWEMITEARPPEFQRYDAITLPPRAHAIGWFRLEDLGGGRTRFHFHEEYRMENRWLAWLLERAVHRFISKDNDKNVRGIIEDGLRAKRQAGTGQP